MDGWGSSFESTANRRTIIEELLTTLLCVVESIVSRQPLTSISDNITDFEALTPHTHSHNFH